MNFDCIRIRTIGEGGVETDFRPSSPIDVVEYSYVSSRMGGATFIAEVRDAECLDGLWTGREFIDVVEGGVETRLYLRGVPSSRKDVDDARYVHSLEFESGLVRVLSGLYFRDAVGDDAASVDRYQSGSYDSFFFGDLREFVDRFNDVLKFRGIEGISVRVEDGVESEEREISLSSITLYEALREAYGVWEVPFYESGSEIIFGEGGEAVPGVVFGYGADRELLKIEKINADAKIVTLCAGTGSSENIPYYYPNETPYGDVGALLNGGEGVVVTDPLEYVGVVGRSGVLRYAGAEAVAGEDHFRYDSDDFVVSDVNSVFAEDCRYDSGFEVPVKGYAYFDLNGGYRGAVDVRFGLNAAYAGTEKFIYTRMPGGNIGDVAMALPEAVAEEGICFHLDNVKVYVDNGGAYTGYSVSFETLYEDLPAYTPEEHLDIDDEKYPDGEYPLKHLYSWMLPERRLAGFSVDLDEVFKRPEFARLNLAGRCFIEFDAYVYTPVTWWDTSNPPMPGVYDFDNPPMSYSGFLLSNVGYSRFFEPGGWLLGGVATGRELGKMGLAMTREPVIGDEITLKVLRYIRPTGVLMPSIYRETDGAERALPALNDVYLLPDGSGYYQFENEYDAANPREHMESFEDVKPSIENLKDALGNPLNVVRGVHFDPGYNIIETVDGKQLKYSQFYMQIGPLGFNLFDCGLEGGSMGVVMLDGDCGACRFNILTTEDYENPVQVREDGSLKLRADGYVDINSGNIQERQNDTTSNAVWVCLSLDDSTYGGGEFGVMPSYDASTGAGQKPQEGDRYTLIDISMPKEYIEAAERELDAQIVKFMSENNAEKYNFAIEFSRVYLAQNPEVRDALSGHCSLKLSYDGQTLASPLHVLQYTRKQEGDALPEISVELGDAIESRSSGLKARIASEIGGIVKTVQGGGDLNTDDADKRYIRKDVEDVSEARTGFRKGLTVGEYVPGVGGRGAALIPASSGDVLMEVDYLNVRKKATFSEVVVDKLKSVGGRLLVSLASLTCKSVSYDDEVAGYRCYYDADTDDGGVMFNSFVVGDLAICESYYNDKPRYYWREVVAVKEDYIVLSNAEGGYDADSDVPQAGDVIVQLGNRSDGERQAAQILSCYGEETPSFVMYAGVDGFSLAGKDIHGTVYRNNEGQYKAYFFNYGSMLLGSRDESGDYVKFDAQKGLMTVKALLQLKASQSLSGVKEFDDLVDGIKGYEYLKEALNNDTVIAGGLILSSLIQLGHKGGDRFKVLSGINGTYDPNKGDESIAAWFGGSMEDAEKDADAESPAKSLFRQDGTGYLASGNITWDESGYGSIGGGLFRWGKDENGNLGVWIGNDVKLGDGDSSVDIVLNSKLDKSVWDRFFRVDADGNLEVKAGLYSTKFISARGGDPNTGGGGSGSSISLYAWSQIKDISAEVSGAAPTAFALKQAYDELNTSLGARIDTLANKATKVSVSQTLTTGTEIGKITIDGVSKALYAPSSIAWGSVTEKPTFATVATSGKYSDLSGLPTIPSIAGLASESWVSNNYLAKSGGTIDGNIILNGNITITRESGALYLNTTSTTIPTAINFFKNLVNYGGLGMSEKNIPCFLDVNNTAYTLIHSGNYSDYALPLSGGTITGSITLSGGFLQLVADGKTYGYNTNVSNGEPIYLKDNSWFQLIHSGNIGSHNAGGITNGTTTIALTSNGRLNVGTSPLQWTIGDGTQFLIPNNDYTKLTYYNGSAWKQIAFTDSNVASATKLATPRTIWGQSFDGSGDVSGALSGVTNINSAITINSSGNVTIGSSDYVGTNYKLYVDGSTIGKGNLRAFLDTNSELNVSVSNPLNEAQLGITSGGVAYLFCTGAYDLGISTNSTRRMTITSSGNVLIGTTTDDGVSRLQVNGNIKASGSIYSTTGVYSAGYVSARGADTSSDRRLKDNIAPLTNALDYILKTNYVSFVWKDTREKSIGIIAQEEMGREWGCLVQKHSETYSYLYGQHTALLGAALQEEDKKVEELKAEIARLNAKVNELETRLNS